MLVSIQKAQVLMKISDKSTHHLFSNKITEKIETIQQKEEKILCNHCMRTVSNGIRCMGICVADNDYWVEVVIDLTQCYLFYLGICTKYYIEGEIILNKYFLNFKVLFIQTIAYQQMQKC